MKSYDVIVVGAGQAGPPLAERFSQAGKSVAIVERHLVGGTCVNTGCMPTKTLVASAAAAHVARRAADFGVDIGGPVRVDMKAVQARSAGVASHARHGVESWIAGMKNCTLYRGHARFESAREIAVGDERLTAERIFLNVGGRARVPDLPGIGEVQGKLLNNRSILELATLPEHLVVIGGSYIGLEFAQMYRRFGSQVTVIEMGPRLVAREDEDISAAIKTILEAEGISVRLDAKCIHFAARGDQVGVGLECSAGAPEIVGSHVLLAVGRRPNTDDLALEKAGISRDPHGYVEVDDQLRTTAPNVWAMGDCNGKGAFTHTAYNDFEIVAANLLDGESRRVSDRVPAYALYIDPPLGRVGMTEIEAKKAGKTVRVGQRMMTRVGRAIEKSETQGFMKVLVDAETDAILGAAILGVGGDEAIHGLLDMMNAKAPYTTLQHAVPIHPTVSELIPTMLGELKPSNARAPSTTA